MVEIKISNERAFPGYPEVNPNIYAGDPVPVDRIKMIKAMEYIARQMNDENAFYFGWLQDGVPDGEIEYGDLSVKPEDRDPDSLIGFMAQDNNFSELMRAFLWCMKTAWYKGGLHCDGATSN